MRFKGEGLEGAGGNLLVVVVEELVLWSEHDSKCESVESLHSRA